MVMSTSASNNAELFEAESASAVGEHMIGAVRGKSAGPTLFVVGSIHGNEPAGAEAAHNVFVEVARLRDKFCGEVIFLKGNTRALRRGQRYIDTDLNRHWTEENLARNTQHHDIKLQFSEDEEQRELIATIQTVSERARGEVFFLDLHTTSADGLPFVTLGDTLRNRAFALNFPATILLGIEEQLDGTFLEYMNNLGAVTLGFEAGQHTSATAVKNDEAVIWIALVAAGCLRFADAPDLTKHRSALERAAGGQRFIEIRYRHAIRPEDDFKMEPGFENFQTISRRKLLAKDKRGPVRAREGGMVVMPLYQTLGDDGFFLGREIRPVWLRLSSILRRARFGNYMHLLPGVSRHATQPDTLIVNTRVARLFPLQVFHLLGFRRRRWSGTRLEVSRRRYDLKGPDKFSVR